MLERALRTIPLGTQTFSKSRTQYPHGVSPYYVSHAKGSHVWDVDGNEYVDFVNSLAAITLGYRDPDVDAAVVAQLNQGVVFSLPHPIEVEVAEAIVAMVPCAEMVRYGKNGSDATAGAVRVARAYTSRDHVAVCGYHGWQDWYIGSTPRDLGVPAATSALTHSFTYNDLQSLVDLFEKYPGQIAAVIMEPTGPVAPAPGFLESVAQTTRDRGALFILDETVTGFRFANGGAQEFYGVTPDLATFGKGVANGYPLSVVAGKAEYMRLMEEVFFSFTFGGETLSLAAGKATLDKLAREPVVETLARQGGKVIDGVGEAIRRHGVGEFVSISGHPAWSFLTIGDAGSYTGWQLKSLFAQEMFARGILILGTHNMSYAHSDDDIRKLIEAYEAVLPLMKRAVEENALDKLLRCEPLEPLFKIR
jgi:glutamate-1-semialdehyde 2,1-aminomutase